MKTVIVGGSIAGCATAQHLHRSGHDVSVLERSSHLVSRGIAVGTAAAALADMTAAALLPVDFPHCTSNTLAYVRRGHTGDERLIGSVPLAWATMRWQDLHQALRAGVPAEVYQASRTVTAVTAGTPDTPATVTVNGGDDRLRADLVVLADGNRSLARTMRPFGSRHNYTGLALLRGLVSESSDDRGMYDQLTRTMFAGGHAVSYTVPGPDGDTTPGHRDVMWGIYLTVDELTLTKLTLPTPADTAANAIAGQSARVLALNTQQRDGLLARVLPLLPDAWIERIARTELIHLQPVYDATTTTLHHQRICLIGDAGSVYPPFNANGVMKATRMAASLTQHIAHAEHDHTVTTDA